MRTSGAPVDRVEQAVTQRAEESREVHTGGPALAARRLGLLVAGVAATALVWPLWFTTSPGTIDPWVYWGLARHFSYGNKFFADTYYAKRFASILPEALLQQLLPPLTAEFVMRSLLLAVLVGACFVSVRRLFSVRAAYFTAAYVLLDRFLLGKVGWAYSDGTGTVALAVTAVAVVVASQARSRPHRLLAWAGAGAAFGLVVTNYLGLIAAGPAVTVFAVVLLAPWRRGGISRVGEAVAATASGFVATIAAFAVVNRVLTDSWDFLAPSFRLINEVGENNPFSTGWHYFWSDWLWSVSAIWFYPMAVLAVAAPVCALAARNSPSRRHLLAVGLFLATFVVTWVGFEAAGQSFLTHHFGATYLAVPTALAVGGLADLALRSVPRRVWLSCAALFAGAGLMTAAWFWWIRVDYRRPAGTFDVQGAYRALRAGGTIGVVVGVVLLVAATVLVFLGRRNSSGRVVIGAALAMTLGMAGLLFASNTGVGGAGADTYTSWSPGYQAGDVLNTIADVDDEVHGAAGTDQRIWLLLAPTSDPTIKAIQNAVLSAELYLYSWIGATGDGKQDCAQLALARTFGSVVVGVLGPTREPVRLLLTQAEKCRMPPLTIDPIRSTTVTHGSIHFPVTTLRVKFT